MKYRDFAARIDRNMRWDEGVRKVCPLALVVINNDVVLHPCGVDLINLQDKVPQKKVNAYLKKEGGINYVWANILPFMLNNA